MQFVRHNGKLNLLLSDSGLCGVTMAFVSAGDAKRANYRWDRIMRQTGAKWRLAGRLCWLVLTVLAAGCRAVPEFPQRAMSVATLDGGNRLISFDTDKDRKADYRQREDRSGRKVELRFNGKGDEAKEVVPLDEVAAGSVPHFIIALDGVPYRLVEELYVQGHFRLFYRPSRVVTCFPGMTDVAFQRLFGGRTPIAYQSRHFDRKANRLINGNELYLSGKAANWTKKLDYRCSFKLDALAYIEPQLVFEHELRAMAELFHSAPEGTKIAYSVATAGLGTQGGREAIIEYLRTIDRFCEQIVYERKGRVKLTLLADHGHSMSGRGRVSFKELLEEKGYRLTNRLQESGDVVAVEYGLVTYAAFHTDRAAAVAGVLLSDPAVTVACYPTAQGSASDEDAAVVVETIGGKAVIRKSRDAYSYEREYGDPLDLADIVDRLREAGRIDENGFIDDDSLFAATVDHIYPDPLRRVWLSFNGSVQKPADLIVCLKDGWVHGSTLFNTLIGRAASSHGSLNQLNSMTFAMTMLGELPAAMRLEEVMPAVERLRER